MFSIKFNFNKIFIFTDCGAVLPRFLFLFPTILHLVEEVPFDEAGMKVGTGREVFIAHQNASSRSRSHWPL